MIAAPSTPMHAYLRRLSDSRRLGTEHSVRVAYEDGIRLELGEALYRMKRYQPPLEELL